ncbi:telomeric repeat binding factor a [Embiotoca jacksoni]|uniref:telomeric repeat binding factor a n=1 Tax=Embiotoca jacksoni TaxID=100190 RepID=UPI003704D17F
MADKDVVNSDHTDVEPIVNRWLVDYYSILALDFLKNEQYENFSCIRDVLELVIRRPLESTDVMPAKVRILQFLSRIHEGDNLDLSFESDPSVTPLESALSLLEQMSQEGTIQQQDFDNVGMPLKEMIVGILIKNNRFDKAKEMLNKHFPKPMVGKKAIFMGLIRQKSKTHEVIEQINFQQFRQEMLAFCQKLCSFSVPFLHKAAKQLICIRHKEQNGEAAENVEAAQPILSSDPQLPTLLVVPCKLSIIQKTRLEAVYKSLTAGLEERTFVQLEDEVETEEQEINCSLQLLAEPKRGANLDSQQEGPFQRDSGSPMEASPADQPPQTDDVPQTHAGSLSKTPRVQKSRWPFSVARLVVEPDSQACSQCTTDSQKVETEVITETPPQIIASSNKNDLQCPDTEVAIPTSKRAKRSHKTNRASTSLDELSADSEKDSAEFVDNMEMCGGELRNQSSSSRRGNYKSKQLSEDSEEELLASCEAPVQKSPDPLSKNTEGKDATCIADSSLDISPNESPHPVPRTSSTPHKDSAEHVHPTHSKWKMLFQNAKETKEKWSDEELHFRSRNNSESNDSTISNSGHRKRKWTEKETQNLKDGVKRFGEGNWSKIKTYYSFNDRTNVNLKDRWRTMKKSGMA